MKMIMYKELFRQVVDLLTQPRKAWEELVKKEEKGDEFLVKFVYPLIGLVTASAFIGVLFTEKTFSVELAIKSSIKALFSSFGGFFLAAWLLNKVWTGFLKRDDNLRLWQRFVGYSSVAMFVIHIVLTLIPLLPLSDFIFLRIIILFVATVYIVWEGVMPYMKIGERIRFRVALLVSVFIVLLPEIINAFLFLLLPGLRV
ncbi:MAG: YIP1 family protein [Tannerellaceae bacterium]|jgi:hypothetical protein|nr:YIP1 family protein [Tannerellaceae bacterium]